MSGGARALRVGGLLAAILAVSGCSEGATPGSSAPLDAAPAPTFGEGSVLDDPALPDRDKVRLVLTGGCQGNEGCHVSAAAGLSFEREAGYASLIDVPSTEDPRTVRVRPGDPEASYLLRKLRPDSGAPGDRMPLVGAPYDPRLPELFARWIEAGAPPVTP